MPPRPRAPIIALHVLVVALWLSLHAPSASEGPAWLDANVSGAPACIDGASLQARSEALLGPGVTPPPTRVELEVRDDAGTFDVHARLHTADELTERSLSGSDCSTLGDAIALVIAVHVDPLSVASTLSARPQAAASTLPSAPAIAQPEPERESEPEAGSRDPVARRPEPRPPGPERPPRARPSATLGASALAELGVLPRAAAALQLGIGVRWRHAAAELAGVVSVGPRASAPDDDAITGTFRLFAGALRGCGLLGPGRLQAALCGGLELGDLWAQGDGLDAPNTLHTLWVAPTLGVRPLVQVHRRIALGGVVDLLVPLRRHRFAVPQAGTVHAVAPIAARLGLTLEVRLP